MNENAMKQNDNKKLAWGNFLFALMVIITLFAGAYLRLVGVNWDEGQHVHPDERFLSMVQAAISPVESISDYFDTANSSLNPANRGHGFFVYGTLPIFIVRYVGEMMGQTDYGSITLLGRQISAIFDVLTILLVFAVGKRLYNRWVGLLGAIFYALAVLPIQLSHYMTVETATNTFAFLAVFAAAWALKRSAEGINADEENSTAEYENDLPKKDMAQEQPFLNVADWKSMLRDLAPYILFGIALGAATASKINAVVLAVILPLVEGMRYAGMDAEERRKAILPIIRNILVAAVFSFVVFRIGQPYAFEGPGFFNIGINENWWSSMQSLRAQASGDVDFPPALQWARRPVTFSWQNMVAWGLGWPLGVLAWTSYLWMGIKIIRKENWRVHLPLWLFTGLYFAWQSLSWVRTMRYQMIIYPALALFAGWGLVSLWTVRNSIRLKFITLKPKLIRIMGYVVAFVVVLTTAIYAFAISRIYTRPHNRLAASRWIYQNIPGPLTLKMVTSEGEFNHPLWYDAGDTLEPEGIFAQPFYAVADGEISHITIPNILDQNQSEVLKIVVLSIVSANAPEDTLASALIQSEFLPAENNWRGAPYEFVLDQPVSVVEGELYYLKLDLVEGDTTMLLNGSPFVSLVTSSGMEMQSYLPRIQKSIRSDRPFTLNVRLLKDGVIEGIFVPHLVDQAGSPGLKDLQLDLNIMDHADLIGSSRVRSAFLPETDNRGEAYHFLLDTPIEVEADQTLTITFSTANEGAYLVPHALAPVHESSWDDGIPYSLDGFGAYDENGGVYLGGLNFEMYWADDQQKLERFERNLDLGDYIFITSNRQWGTTTRVPERYLLTTHYYQNLLGCSSEKDIEWCYSVAEPGMFEENLGFELVATFQSNPSLGPIEYNTQFAEEAFTVYDHPKVLIFKKTDAYDPIRVRETLRTVDLDKVVYFTPGEAAHYKGPKPDELSDPRFSLMLSEERLAEQREGGTWSELFNQESLINTSQPVAVIAFYLFVTLLGLLTYPVIRIALPGLDDRGYPLSKLAGMVLLAFIVWVLGSFRVPVTRMMILSVIIGLSVLSLVFIILQRKLLWEELRHNWRYYLAVEVLALIAFGFFMLIRLGNPDLWHPYKGGEKPMDFSYLNAVIKSTTFPPYDPWFAGGYINYYYYGFVIVGMPIKLLGITPSVAYNIVLPLWYSILILGAFSVGWNLYQGIPRSRALRVGEGGKRASLKTAFWVGLATAIGLAVLGNLGTVKLITTGYQRLAAGGASIEEAALFQRIQWTFQGFKLFLQGSRMPFYPGDWYWFASRVIPGEPITEFPFFTFIYGDLHAHLLAFPVTIFAISWSLSLVLSKGRWGEKDGRFRILGLILSFLLGAIVIGALRATNTWDFYTYSVLASLTLIYTILRHSPPRLKLKLPHGDWVEKACKALIAVLALVLLAILFYQPFAHWYGQAYNQVKIWEGDRTPLGSYFTHWGLFLFIIVSWMAWETYHWLKTTPQSALKRLEPHLTLIYAALILFLVLMVVFFALGAVVALVAVPVGLWAVVLMLRPQTSDGARFLLFLIGTAVTITLIVEVIYLPGDIGRMNTVFKFYLQAWIMFSLSAGVCFGWLIKSLRYWNERLMYYWQAILFILLVSAMLFTVLGTTDKIRDRIAPDAPQNLDGMAYMVDATYFDVGGQIQLVEDQVAIQWMQENIQGSPVILEGQAFEYRWGNRFTVYTGLPGVVGWNWHQRQQRAIWRNNAVQERVDAVNTFYTTEDMGYVMDFLEEHDVAYIVLGQLEHLYYPGAGLEKFPRFTGDLWQEVFRFNDTILYEVID